jgi:hypothetical protein
MAAILDFRLTQNHIFWKELLFSIFCSMYKVVTFNPPEEFFCVDWKSKMATTTEQILHWTLCKNILESFLSEIKKLFWQQTWLDCSVNSSFQNMWFCVNRKSKMAAIEGHSFNRGTYMTCCKILKTSPLFICSCWTDRHERDDCITHFLSQSETLSWIGLWLWYLTSLSTIFQFLLFNVYDFIIFHIRGVQNMYVGQAGLCH